MNGWLEDGTSVELTPTEERIALGIIGWANDGMPFTLPAMGRGAGKTTIMSTVAHYFSQAKLASQEPDPMKYG